MTYYLMLVELSIPTLLKIQFQADIWLISRLWLNKLPPVHVIWSTYKNLSSSPQHVPAWATCSVIALHVFFAFQVRTLILVQNVALMSLRINSTAHLCLGQEVWVYWWRQWTRFTTLLFLICSSTTTAPWKSSLSCLKWPTRCQGSWWSASSTFT